MTRRAALITGGGGGIGAATAVRLARAGWSVAICGRRRDALQKISDETGALPLAGDVADPVDAARIVARTVEEHGRLDGLVLNAGIIRPGALLDLTIDDFDATFRTNVTGVFLMAQQALPHLLEARGAVVTVSSVAALRTSEGMSAYGASKAAATLLTQSLAIDYGPRGLRANVICPGWTATEMADAEMAEFGSTRNMDAATAYRLATSLVPTRRPATADEVARSIEWLLSDGAAYVNAAVIPVDGGQCAVDAGTVPFDSRVSVQT